MVGEGGLSASVRPLCVCVGICTYRRNSQLARLLHALGRLRFSRIPPPSVWVVVIDNSPGGEARETVACHGRDSTRYVHLGAVNIAAGRNAVLAHAADADFLACLDDDEVPEPEWLEELLIVQRETDADMVVGPVRPLMPETAPAWFRDGNFFDLGDAPDRSDLTEGITGNALLRLSRVRELGLVFDERLGASGGEDQVFFRTAVHRGATVRYAARAVVHESVPAERVSARYLVAREFRKGTTLGLLDRGAAGWPPPHPILRTLKSVRWCVRGALLAMGGVARGRRATIVSGVLQLSRAAGMIAGLCGYRFDEYRRRQEPATSRAKAVLVFVAAEDPGVQTAGQSQFLTGFLDHYSRRGFRVVLLVTTGRLASIVSWPGRRSYEVSSPALVRAGQLTFARPAAAIRYVAWSAFRRAPAPLQRAVDGVRTLWRRKARRLDYIVGIDLDSRQVDWVDGELERLAPAAVFFTTLFSVPTPLRLPDSVRASYVLTVDVMSDRAAAFEEAGYEVVPRGFSAATESARLRAVPNLVAIQWDDAEKLRTLVPEANVLVCTPSFVLPQIVNRQPVPGRCLFVGSGTLHNVDGISWFFRDCWPEIVARCPGADLHVVGTVCARVSSPPAGVLLRGEVDDVASEYAAASLVVVPLRVGSGLKVKLVEALCHGVAAVSTTVGAQGLLAIHPRPFALADEPADFVENVVSLLSDECRRNRLEGEARAVAPRFAPDYAYRELDDDLTRVGVVSNGDGTLRTCQS